MFQGLTFGDLEVERKMNVKQVRRRSRAIDVQRRKHCMELSSDHLTSFKCGKKRKQGVFQEDLMEKNGGIIGILEMWN